MAHPIIATFKAERTANTEEVVVCVREWVGESGHFEVFVNGGLCSTGVESFITGQLRVALSFAAQEVAIALEGN